MKKRYIEPELSGARKVSELALVLSALDDPDTVAAFLRDLCTPAELEALADRWSVVPYLDAGLSYRDIHDRSSVSVTTIGRVARCLSNAEGGYRLASRKLKRKKLWPEIINAESSV